jgi:protein-S-isoprenylcysteine O-methyltransferase Ste14
MDQRTANVALAGWLAADAVRAVVFVGDFETDLLDGFAGVLFAVTAVFVLRRASPRAQDATHGAVAVALAATMLPAFLAWLAPARAAPSSYVVAIQGAAVLLMGTSLLYLRTNFSIVPQYRTLVTGGPYSLVRHPIYASYLIFDGALVLDAGSWVGGGLWLAEGCLLLMRARLEERLLLASEPAYQTYLAQVRWRFVPGAV